MSRRRLLLSLLGAALLLPGGAAIAHSFKAEKILVGHPWAQPSDGPDASAFVALLNDGTAPDRLLRADTPVAESIRIRDLVDGTPTKVEALAVPPKQPIPMRPGARDLLLVGLKRPLKLGDKFPLTLHFEKSGPVTVEIFVETEPGH